MDDRSFDRLARLLGEASDRRTGLKALVGGILGAGGIAALSDNGEAKRKKKKKKRKCDPACESGFTCVKGTCTCASGVACAGACCAAGQVCRDGACSDRLPACLEFGAECKQTGRRCCDGLTCASGQDGSYPVTCLKAKGAACDSTAECPFGMSCTDGRCLGDGAGSVPTGASCAGGETCAQPGATCGAYTTQGAPAGQFCTLPLRKVCTGNPECACFNCWYVNEGATIGGRQGRAAPQKACIQPKGAGCSTKADCALGLDCENNVCTGTAQCAPGGAPCGGGVACCGSSTCDSGVCSGGGGGGGGGCTINRSDYADDVVAGNALKELVKNAQDGDVIKVSGPGTYKPTPDTGQRAALVISKSITIQACDPANKPTIDGGNTVNGSDTVNAKNLVWGTVGNRIILVQANKTVTIDGINLTNGNAGTDPDENASDFAYGGAVLAVQPSTLTLKNLDISRSRTGSDGYGGAVAAYSGSTDIVNRKLTLQNVNITQCRAADGGAVKAYYVPLEISGAPAAKAKLTHNYASDTGGAVYHGGNYTNAQLTAFRTNQIVTLSHVEVKNNLADSEAGGLFLSDAYVTTGGAKGGTGTASLSDMVIADNSADEYAGGLSIQFGDAPGTTTGATLTNVVIQNNALTDNDGWGGGVYNAGRLVLGAGVSITGNKAAKGSGVFNDEPTENVTCASENPKKVRDNTNNSPTFTPAANGQAYADCYGGDGSGAVKPANNMPAGCCATNR